MSTYEGSYQEKIDTIAKELLPHFTKINEIIENCGLPEPFNIFRGSCLSTDNYRLCLWVNEASENIKDKLHEPFVG